MNNIKKAHNTAFNNYIKNFDSKISWVFIIVVVLFTLFMIDETSSNPDRTLYDEFAGYYDMNGNEYGFYGDVPLYDKDGNCYYLNQKLFQSPCYLCGEDEYEISLSYISADGYFYYDDNESLMCNTRLKNGSTVYYDIYKNEYVSIGEFAYFDKNGDVVHGISARGGAIHEYAFK